ncbi:MAG: hypothetical protein V3Q69_14055 (plasmid) [Burkholderia sp.]
MECKPTRLSASSRRCCINRARSVDVYAQRSRGQPPIKSDSRVICLIFAKKIGVVATLLHKSNARN